MVTWSHCHKLQPEGLALALQNSRPGQSPQEATILAQLGLAYLGLAWPGSQPEARPCTSLISIISVDLFSRVSVSFLGFQNAQTCEVSGKWDLGLQVSGFTDFIGFLG